MKRISIDTDCGAVLVGRFQGAAVFLVLAMLMTAPGARAANAFVRINQLGYEAGVGGRAYLMSTASESGAAFKAVNAKGVTVFSRAIGAMLGTWGKFTVYALDFEIDTAGTYTIDVSGPANAVSPSFRVGPPRELYSQGLANALSFYQNERDGSDFVRTPLRTNAGHLHDSHATIFATPQFDDNDNMTTALQPTGGAIDASGGWWDAGDYLKFVQTHSYTVALMLTGIRDFPEQMGSAAHASANFTNEAKFGLRWLRKMWDDDTRTLYYQVGIGTDFTNDPNTLSDHDVWRLPQVDDTLGGTDPTLKYIRHRPVFIAAPAGSKISPNLAGRLTADFALCSQVFRESNPELANECLLSAEHVFALADTAPPGDLLTVAPFDFYGETEWRDDMELGATELYFALASAESPGALPSTLPHTDSGFYLHAAAHWAHAYITGPNDAGDTLNLYDVSGLAHFELFRAIAAAGHPKSLEATQADLVADLRKELQNAMTQGATDPFGFGFPWDTFDTATHGAGPFGDGT